MVTTTARWTWSSDWCQRRCHFTCTLMRTLIFKMIGLITEKNQLVEKKKSFDFISNKTNGTNNKNTHTHKTNDNTYSSSLVQVMRLVLSHYYLSYLCSAMSAASTVMTNANQCNWILFGVEILGRLALSLPLFWLVLSLSNCLPNADDTNYATAYHTKKRQKSIRIRKKLFADNEHARFG